MYQLRSGLIAGRGALDAAAAGGGGGTTTLDPVNKDPDVTLSGGNLTATDTGGDAFMRSSVGHTSGKYYYEVTLGAWPTFGGTFIGAADGSNATNGSGGFLGNGTHGVGAPDSGGWAGAPSGTTTSPTYFTPGDVVCLAIDIDNGKIWIRLNAGNWNSNGTANPATNVNGATFNAGMTGGSTIYAAATLGNNNFVTFNFGATAYAQTPPSGFGNM